MSELILIDENKKTTRFPLTKPVTVIGSDRNCDIVLESMNVSPKHARIIREGNAYYLEDLESKTGTKINGAPINYDRLKDSDEIIISRYKFIFRLTEERTAKKHVSSSSKPYEAEEEEVEEITGEQERPIATLTIFKNNQIDRSIPITKEEILIGRGNDCDVVLKDPIVSSHHARLYRGKTSFILKDLKSRNGTFVDGNKIEEIELGEKKRFEIGPFSLQFEQLMPFEYPEDEITQKGAIPLKELTKPEEVDQVEDEFDKLVIISDKYFRQEFLLKKDMITIGREVGNDIVIADDSISRSHAIIFRQDGKYTIEDQESLNGTDVNGVKITQPTPIKHGDLIRIGGIHFQFVEKGQAYILKRWSEIEEEFAEKEEKKKPPINKKRLILIVAVAVMAIVVVILIYQSMTTPPIPVSHLNTHLSGTTPVFQLLQEAKKAMELNDWDNVIKKCEKALQYEPQNFEAIEYIEVARRELGFSNLLQDGQKKIDEQEFFEAVAIFQKIPETSVYYHAAQNKIKEAKSLYVKFHLEKGKQLFAENKYNQAIDEFERVLAVEPNNEEALQWIDKAEFILTAPRRESPVAVDYNQKAAKFNAEGMEKYLKGDIEGSLEEYKKTLKLNLAATNKNLVKAKEMIDLISKIQMHYQSGIEAKNVGNNPLSIEKFYQALKLDLQIDPSRKSHLFRALSQEVENGLIASGQTSYDNGDLKSAYKFFSRALVINPENSKAKENVNKIESKAKEIFHQGYLLEEGNPPAAIKKFNEVMAILPEDHEYYQKAKAKVEKLQR